MSIQYREFSDSVCALEMHDMVFDYDGTLVCVRFERSIYVQNSSCLSHLVTHYRSHYPSHVPELWLLATV